MALPAFGYPMLSPVFPSVVHSSQMLPIPGQLGKDHSMLKQSEEIQGRNPRKQPPGMEDYIQVTF
jgi:hypothetical protein